ncbi:HAD family phosphatase [Pseudoduganella ginsengisoli]|uniref:HAD-IA family hydrolase n=1 Tax=Pseudoduganella ginsengisoli TaxID=1462440 RepID=A0A6L6PZU7_9BURK|nr:HAD-IA family hydrolase [Pseudoduganella ginsengisoli]MTW02895.1 HAD-IA family hydrolase [Pseudoduganella ginsengisoli]
MTVPPPQVLLFDLGGVLIDIDFQRILAAWAPYSRLSLEQLQQLFCNDLPYQRHERGEITASEYFAHIAQTLQLQAPVAQIEAGWNAIFQGEIAEAVQLVSSLRGTIPCHAFTNTNASHMACWMRLYPAVAQSFGRVFASHQIGLRKPERAAFEHICRELDVRPEAVLFFDDLAENVEAANAAGLRGVLVRHTGDIAAALADNHVDFVK